MSFKTTPLQGPAIVKPATANFNSSSSKAAAREAAIAAFVGNQPQSQETPVKNPSQVSPEEMTAIKASSKPQETQKSEQKYTSETDSKAPSEENKETKNPLSSQYAQLARKERAIRAEAQRLKAEKEAIAAQEQAIKAKELEYQSKYINTEKLKADPLNTLNELGLTYQQLTDLMLAQGNPEQLAQAAEFKRIEAEIQKVREAQEAAIKAQEEAQQQSYKQALAQIRMDTKHLVSTDPSFEVIKATNSVNDVVDLIEKTFRDEGILLSVEEAAQEVEEFLTERAEKLAKLGKIQSRLTPKPSQSEQKQVDTQDVKQPQQMKTLTNAVGTSRPMTARERAIAAFKGGKV